MKIVEVVFLAFLFFVFCCNNATENTEKKVRSIIKNEKSSCTKCDTMALFNANKNLFNLTKEELENFLCAFDKNCDWPTHYFEKYPDNYFSGESWDMLFVFFGNYFDMYLEILEENKNLNLDYLIELYSNPAVYDLPHTYIFEDLQNIPNRSIIQERVFQAFKKSISDSIKEFKE